MSRSKARPLGTAVPLGQRQERCRFSPDRKIQAVLNLLRGESLRLRHDGGRQYLSDPFQAELRFLGIESGPAFVRPPAETGSAEPSIRTLREQLLWVQIFHAVEKARQAFLALKTRYSQGRLLERHRHWPLAAIQAAYKASLPAAAWMLSARCPGNDGRDTNV